MRGWVAAVALALSSSVATPAVAAIKLSVMPMLGREGAASHQFGAVAVRLESDEPSPVRGRVEVLVDGSREDLATEAPFSLAPSGSALFKLPVRGGTGGYIMRVRAVDEGGKVLASDDLNALQSGDPLLLVLEPLSRLPAVMKGSQLPLGYVPYGPSYGPSRSAHLAVTTVPVDVTTGDPLLPEHAGSYSLATAVIAPSDTLSRMTGPELEALAGYVLSGGTLAIVPKRPEDLRHPTIVAFAGGDVRDDGAAKALAMLSDEPVARDASQAPQMVVPPTPAPTGSAESPPAPTRLKASKAVSERLVQYAGGNLAPSDLGATAPYGLGEVHVLPFDPAQPQIAEDPWVQARLGALVSHAWQRRAHIVFENGGRVSHDNNLAELRRKLDPNDNARFAIIVAAVLLMIYAVLAGPVNFLLSTRAGKPLRALVNLPIFSAITFALVVVVGVVSRGVRGEARRVALVEASGGMSKATVRRYRGFFSPGARTFTVRSTDPTSLLSTTSDAGGARLAVDRAGLRLEGVRSLPWQTVIIREDGLTALGGGLAIARAPGDDLLITNRTGRDLRGVIVKTHTEDLFFFDRLEQDKQTLASAGTRLPLHAPPSGSRSAGSKAVHMLGMAAFRAQLDGVAKGLVDTWSAVDQASQPRGVDHWPSDQPVVLAQIEGGEGQQRDGGLSVTTDWLLLRVVGFGGGS